MLKHIGIPTDLNGVNELRKYVNLTNLNRKSLLKVKKKQKIYVYPKCFS